MLYALLYEYTDDYLQRRGEFKAAHLKLAWEAQARGELMLSGAYANPSDGALMIFQCNSPEPPRRFAAADPFVKHGLVKRWKVRQWTTVVGLGRGPTEPPK